LQRLSDTLAARVEELEAERARVMHIGQTDALTGVLNRGAFLSGLTERLSAARRFGVEIALVVIDLDHFKDVNDTLGHEAGDLILQEAAVRLSDTLGPADMVARLGGDEFAVVADIEAGSDQAQTLAAAILAALAKPMRLMGRNVTPGASLGVALYPAQAADAGELQRFADLALYRAKAEGRGVYSLFDEALRLEGERRRTLEAELRVAAERGEITPWFQPVVDASTGLPVSVEVLARWNHPRDGLVGPDRFIPIAEEIGIIGEIDANVFEQACKIAGPWVTEGLISSMACNVSPRELLDPRFADAMLERIEANAFPPKSLVVEITETFLLQDMELAKRHIERLATRGVRVALDDFGIGYSNLRALMQLPIATVKIDRSLTMDVGVDERMTALVGLLAQTTRALGLGLVAEGVEDEAHAAHLRALGCHRMQGYWFARPMPAQQMEAYLRKAAATGLEQPARDVA